MDRKKMFDCLYLDDHQTLYEQVQPVACIQGQPFVGQRYPDLPSETQAPEPQLVNQTFFIGRLQKSGADRPVNLESSPDDQVREFVGLFLGVFCVFVAHPPGECGGRGKSRHEK